MGGVKGYVFVTGGDRGIGRAIVLRFAREGYAVYFSYRTNKPAADETLELVRKLGGQGGYVQMDVSLLGSVESAYRAIEKQVPYLNVLVNNAGVVHVGSIKETSLDDWNRVMAVNLTGVFLVTKVFLPLLEKAPWASIVNVSSIAGQTGNVVASATYAASKAGVIGLTKRLAVELAPKIRVNAVAPSFVRTDMAMQVVGSPGKLEDVKKLHPLMDVADPEDVANAVFFLATPESRFVTGQVLGVNGGRLT